MAESASGGESGAVLSDGELEEGEVLSSDEEDEEKEHKTEEKREKGERESGVITDLKDPVGEADEIGQKHPGPPAQTHAASPHSKDASSPKGASTAVVANSDVEEGEIFSDDEEAAYFPQLVKSRSSENHSQERESQEGERDRSEREKESDGSESEAVEERRSGEKRKFRFDYSASPERDSYVPRWKRPKERDKSTKATSLASLFFEDRDGTRSEQSDDSRDTRERRSDQFHSSSSRHSHGYTSSKHSRERDRDRDRDRDSADRDRDRKDRSSSYYRHEKESRRSRDRDRERERDQDSTVDSSDEELPWSRHSHTSRYQSHQKGRRSANTHQLKYGQKQERFSGTTGESRGGGGRQGSREISQQSNWGPSPGVMNTGMTAQQFNALAERVRKRREKGLPLLPTPKIKPGDNLDQFNYPAPPSWYLEALEKWDEAQKERMLVDSREKAGVESSSFLEPGSYDMQEPSGAPTYNTEPQMVPQPLFKHDPLNVHGVGSLVSTLMPPIPLMPAQEPSPNPPPIIIHGQPNVIIPVNEPPISLFPGGYLVPKVAENEGPNFKNEERTNERTDPVIINPVVCSISTDAQVLDDEDDAEGVGMKIAVETPTPQADATTKFFQPTSENDTVNNEADPVPMATNELLESDAGKAPEVAENMDIDEPCESTEDTGLKSPSSPVIPQEAESQDSSVPSLSSPPVKSDPSSLATSTSPTSVAIPIAPGNTSVAAPATNQPTTSPDFGGHGTTTSVDTNPTTATGGAPLIHPLTKDFETMDEDSSQEEENENSMESDEDDFDYDKYLDQLDEEEEEEGEVKEKAPISSVMGSLASDLLLNNPLDEDFPTINPANEPSQKKEESISLKSLVGGTSCTMDDAENDTNVLSKTKVPKKGRRSVRRRERQAEFFSRHKKQEEATGKPLCRFYMNGFCKHGDNCQYRHDGHRPKRKEICRFYLQDMCLKGDNCHYYHSSFPCKFYHSKSFCKSGDNCKFSHDPLTDETRELLAQVLDSPKDLPKHMGLPTMETGLPTSASIFPANPIAPLPSASVFPVDTQMTQGPLNLQHGAESQARVKFFTSNESASPDNFPGQQLNQHESIAGDSSAESPLVVSIPKRLIDKSLIISIPRQKLGPPFGTIPISCASSAPPTTPLSSSLTYAQPRPFFSPSHPSHLPHPSTQPPTNLFPVPPIQSAPHNFPLPPGHPLPPQPQGLPPRPSGWVPATPPDPLFPPVTGVQHTHNFPEPPTTPSKMPFRQPPVPPQIPPQAQFTPLKQKGLLPTPPLHMQIDPKSIQWSENETPEYWEAPEVSGFLAGDTGGGGGSQPMPLYEVQGQDSNKCPPNLHPPQFASGGLPPHPPMQQSPPVAGFGAPCGPFGVQSPPGPAAQQGSSGTQPLSHQRLQPIATGVDPRQSRIEPGPVSSLDPRRGSSSANGPSGMAPVQPRPEMNSSMPMAGGVPPNMRPHNMHPLPRAPLQLSQPWMPTQPHMAQSHASWPVPHSLQHGGNLQQPQQPAPHLSPAQFPPQSHPVPMPPAASANLMITGNESRGHVPPNSAPHGQFLGQVSAIGHFGTGQNAYPAPMAPQQPTEVGPRAGVWGPRNTEMSPEHSASSVSGTDLQFPKAGEMSAGSEMRSPRLDPRTKYSHFKIKSKGSPTLSHNPPSGGSGAASILKKNELFSRDQSSISGSDNPATSAPMPKLLQNQENLEKPLDPRELFGAGAKEVPSDYGMAGHFGSGFGTYFSRPLESSEKLPFGEITMPEPKKESDAEGDEIEKVETKSEKEPTDKDSTEQRKVEVPSYMAELGLGESGLTIDSAFSSLDKKDQEAENEAQKQKSLDAAKKLPSIFSFSSSSA